MKTLDQVDGLLAGESFGKPVEPHMKHSLMNAQLAGDQPGNSGTQSAKALKRFVKPARLVIAALSVLLTFGAVAGSVQKPTLIIQGEVQAREINVAPIVVGRVQVLHVCKGDKVRKGQLLVSLENQELQARLQQAQAALELAKEHNKIVQAACVEYICAQSNWWVKAKAAAEHAEQTVNRSRALQAAQVISVKELKDSETDLDQAWCCERAAKASFDLAVAVFGNEGKLAAAVNLEQASRRVAELEASVAELALTSPIDGELQRAMVGQGELATPGLPVVSILDPQDVWVRFNLPEDLLSEVRMGTTLRVRVPALGNQEVPVKVNYISPEAGFAIRRAANGARDFDPRTFEVRAVPSQVTEGLRSGISVVLAWRKVN